LVDDGVDSDDAPLNNGAAIQGERSRAKGGWFRKSKRAWFEKRSAADTRANEGYQHLETELLIRVGPFEVIARLSMEKARFCRRPQLGRRALVSRHRKGKLDDPTLKILSKSA
jgi:hypothetical protein